ncbi:MAG: VWA domain-containing protein [Pseudomonas sp.]|nr:VWA domain-containing protein [Pseudomonas sp.]
MFEFAWPWMVLLLPLPWLVHRYLAPVRKQDPELYVPFFNALQTLDSTQQSGLFAWRSQTAVYLLIWFLLVGAAARPQLQGELLEQPNSGRDLLIALDVSSSMLYSDMMLDQQSISRMDFVKHLLNTFISERHGDRLGLILFGSQAYLQAPLTYDHHSVRTWLNEAQPGIAGTDTSIGDAIGLAIKRLRMRPAKHRVLVLITDGANTSGVMSPLAAAQLAARYQIRIYTIGIGNRITAETAENIHDTSGLNLDEQTLQKMAEISAGQYFHATQATDLSTIHTVLNRLEPAVQRHTAQRRIEQLYSWPLASAWLLSMLLIGQRVYRTYRHNQLAEETK